MIRMMIIAAVVLIGAQMLTVREAAMILLVTAMLWFFVEMGFGGGSGNGGLPLKGGKHREKDGKAR